MTVKILSIGLRGLEGYRVQVEVQEVPGIAAMVIVGLPDASVKRGKGTCSCFALCFRMRLF